jgi:hypothetical protein
MKQKICLLLCSLCVLLSCNNQSQLPNTDIDVARGFIKNIFDNKFSDAEKFLLKDETNNQLFERFQKSYSSKSSEEMERYKNADIIVNEILPENDSVTIINYANSYKKDEKTMLKVVRINGQWLVDLKYTMQGTLK